MQLSELLLRGQRRLTGRSDSARLDAEIILAAALGLDRSGMLARLNQTASPDTVRRFSRLLRLRRHGLPVAYLVGQQEFFGRSFRVDPRTLVPRPATEHLVQAIIDEVGARPVRIADVGTGSGNIAITLALELPTATIEASDLSPAALELARENAHQYGVGDRISWRFGSLLEPWMDRIEPEIIVANLPYLPTRAMAEPSIRHEPVLALHGGRDGLDLIERCLRQLDHLPLVEIAVLECRPDQVDTLAFLLRRLRRHPFPAVRPIGDADQPIGLVATRRQPAADR